MTSPKQPAILFDTGHKEELAIDEPELSQLVKLLEINGMTSYTLNTSLTLEELGKYQVVVLGNPLESSFDSQEITAVVSYVEAGGGLLIVSGATIFGKGGDLARNTNLNQIAQHFKFKFSTKAIEPPSEAPDGLIAAGPAGDHPILEGCGHLLLASGVSLMAENTETHLFRAANVIGTPTIAIATESKKGRVIAFGGGTFFFNDYIGAGDHEHLIVQVFRWLAGKSIDLPVKKVSTPDLILDETSATKAILDLRRQLDKIEVELSGLKEVINTSIKEMEKLVRQFQEEEKEN